MNAQHPRTGRFITAAHAARIENGKRSIGNGNPNSTGKSGFGIDLAQPPIPQDTIVEQPRSSWPRGGKAPQSDRLPDALGTLAEPLPIGDARNALPEALPAFPKPGGTMYNTPQGVQRPAQVPGWGFAK